MAAIGSIRKHSTLLLAIVGSAMLLFVLGGALESSSVFFNGPNNEVGEINGTKISYQDFDIKVSELEANSREQLTDQQRQQVRDQVWNDLLKSEVLGVEYKALGLSVTDEELMFIVKNDPTNPSLTQYFTDPQTGQIVAQYANPNGTLNGSAVIEYLKRVVFVDSEEAVEAKSSWNNFQENYLRKPALEAKYAALMAKGVFLTDAELERKEQDNNSRISFLYASSFYNDMSDDMVTVNDGDLKAYYNAHKSESQYMQKELTGAISFVSFAVVASEEDKQALKEELQDTKEAFRNAESDTLFVNEYGDTPFNIRWVSTGMFPPQFDTVITGANEGDVIGPFFNIDKFEMVKVITKKMGPDSVQASHILVQIDPENADAASVTVDSLKAVIESSDNFSELAMQYSKDPGSAEKGGDLGWFTEGQMVAEFNDACFNGQVGDMVVVTTQFGVHLIKIDDQTAPKQKVLVAVVDNVVEASQNTYEKAYNDASTFAITNDNTEKFVEATEGMNLLDAPDLRPGDMSVLGRPNSRQVVRWMFESKLGDVSTPFDLGSEFIVAIVTDVREKGILPLEMVEEQIRAAVVNEKKAEILVEKMNQPDVKAAAAAVDAVVQPANDVPFASFSIPGLGNEQKLLGMAFSLENGQTSTPIIGERGVYVIMLENKDVPPVAEVSDASRFGIMAAFASRANFAPFNALKENATIVDNRYTFF